MAQSVPPKFKEYKDDWGTTAREGYEDRGAFRPIRQAQKQQGSPILRTVGSAAIVGGILWGTYLVTQGGSLPATLQQNHGPVAILGLGLLCSVLGKYLKA